MPSLSHRASRIADVIRQRHPVSISNMLVVGCGNGREALALARSLGCKVTGIDLRDQFEPQAAAEVRLQRADATALPFDTATFDFVYSYHVLEHIPCYRAALSEMNRVLAKGGGLWIGTPNRTRLVGYVGSNATLVKRSGGMPPIGVRDYRGAFAGVRRHAGFTLQGLDQELRTFFSLIDDATLDFYVTIIRIRPARYVSFTARGWGRTHFRPSTSLAGRCDEREAHVVHLQRPYRSPDQCCLQQSHAPGPPDVTWVSKAFPHTSYRCDDASP